MLKKLFRTKSIDAILKESEEGEHKLRRTLSVWELVAIGIGCIIGTGIFVLTGKVAISNAGPGILLSFVICGVACIFAALCYAEFASFIPIAGSAYTYSYATMGELIAWIIGWDLILEYGVATAAVANGWSSHFVNFLDLVGLHGFPQRLALTPFETIPGTEAHGLLNVPAIGISLLIMTLLIIGIRESARVNNIIVAVKIVVALFFIVVGFFFVKAANWSPIVPEFVPSAAASAPAHGCGFADIKSMELWKVFSHWFGHDPVEGFGGWGGILLGAGIIFFAYIGFDAVSTTAEEAKNPTRDVPRGIIWSLLICTVLYILMSAVFTGIVKCDGTLKLDSLGVDKGAPLVYAFKQVDSPWVSHWAAFLVDIGALCGITSVLLVLFLGQSRIFFAMSRDGLMSKWISKIHPKYKTPHRGTIITGIAVAVIAGFIPLGDIAEMANIGTLFAFVLVSAGIIYLRKKHPERKAGFRTPFVPLIPVISMVLCILLMCSLPVITWIRFVVWMAIGLVIYFLYSKGHSSLEEKK